MKRKLPFAIVLSVLVFAIPPLKAAELELVEDDDVIRVTSGGKPVLEYVKTEKPVPDGLESYYRRSGYIHPVFSPNGKEVSGDFPSDHAHQHALFLAWTKTTFEGKRVDFWNQSKETGRIEFREVEGLEREEELVRFAVKHAFVVKTGEESVDALYETWTVTVHKTEGDYFLFDVESLQTCGTEKPFRHDKYHYGGMAFRGNFAWLKEKEDHSILPGDLEYLTSEGKDRWEGNHTRPNWVAMKGKLEGEDTTVVVMSSPKNFRAPQPVRIHPNKPYFCFAPMVEDAFTIKPGEEFVSRYRYLVTSTALDPELIERQWEAYAEEEK